jgi:hypothetical protein
MVKRQVPSVDAFSTGSQGMDMTTAWIKFTHAARDV